ncbi:hypothetical protein CcCBS67573_g09763, partial [Chytriomyces confervae]
MKRSADNTSLPVSVPMQNYSAMNVKRVRMGMGGYAPVSGGAVPGGYQQQQQQQQQFGMMGNSMGAMGMGFNGAGGVAAGGNGFGQGGGMDAGWNASGMGVGGSSSGAGGMYGNQAGMTQYMDGSGGGMGFNFQYPQNPNGMMGGGFNPAFQMNQFQNPMFAGGMGGPHMQGLPNRTVYIGNVPHGATYEDILNMVKFGPLESAKIVEEKSCCFLTFIEATSALSFFNDYQGKRVLIGDHELKFGWGKPSACPQHLYTDVSNGASRTVYIGSVDENITEQVLRAELEPFGPIDQVRILADKHIAF